MVVSLWHCRNRRVWNIKLHLFVSVVILISAERIGFLKKFSALTLILSMRCSILKRSQVKNYTEFLIFPDNVHCHITEFEMFHNLKMSNWAPAWPVIWHTWTDFWNFRTARCCICWGSCTLKLNTFYTLFRTKIHTYSKGKMNTIEDWFENDMTISNHWHSTEWWYFLIKAQRPSSPLDNSCPISWIQEGNCWVSNRDLLL